jgi:hypothetical protein
MLRSRYVDPSLEGLAGVCERETWTSRFVRSAVMLSAFPAGMRCSDSAVLSARSMSTDEVFYEVRYRASLLGGLSFPASEVEVHAQGVASIGAHAPSAVPSPTMTRGCGTRYGSSSVATRARSTPRMNALCIPTRSNTPVGRAMTRRGRPITNDRFGVCHWYGDALLLTPKPS